MHFFTKGNLAVDVGEIGSKNSAAQPIKGSRNKIEPVNFAIVTKIIFSK